jgi:hypothetical protein
LCGFRVYDTLEIPVSVMVELMPPKKPTETAPNYCTYASSKVDDEVYPLARAAAALRGQSTQEFISDAVNELAAKVLSRQPIKRRAPEPKTRKPKN